MQNQINSYSRASTGQVEGEGRLQTKRVALALFWVGLLVAAAFAGVAGWELTRSLRTLTSGELGATIWRPGGAIFMLWAFSVPLGSVLAGAGAFVAARTKPGFAWLAGIGVLGLVILMTVVWSRVYYAPLFGIGGVIILASFFSIVWLWMKKVVTLDKQERTASEFKLVGYLFWMVRPRNSNPLWDIRRSPATESSFCFWLTWCEWPIG